MLTILKSGDVPDYTGLSAVYEERITAEGKRNYPYEDASLQYLLEQQTFYGFVRDFLTKQQGIWFVWRAEGGCKAACRLEPYADGYLLTGLETLPSARGQGYATALLGAVVAHVRNIHAKPIYSHVGKNNHSSLAVHQKCGFTQISDTALMLDGSAETMSCTLKCIINA